MKNPKPVEIVSKIVHGLEVTISIYRSSPGRFRGSWICSSLANCQGSSGHNDSSIEAVVSANEANAHGGVGDALSKTDTQK